jgi:Ala-tRNA(Pro) deacylase
MPATPDDLFAFLATLGIKVSTVSHPPLYTVEDSKALRGQIVGGHTKNLFLKDRRGRLFLLSALAETKIDLKALAKLFHADRFSFGAPELLLEALGVTPGSVTAFAVLNDELGRVSFLLDAALLAHDPVNFHWPFSRPPGTGPSSSSSAPMDFPPWLKRTIQPPMFPLKPRLRGPAATRTFHERD